MESDELGDDERVSQRVYMVGDDVFSRSTPRPRDRGALSAIRGQVTAARAYRLVRSSFRGMRPTEKDGVRHALVSDLRNAGFVVEHSPNRRNPDHVSIRWNGTWDDQVAEEFSNCFSDIVWHYEREEGGSHGKN